MCGGEDGDGGCVGVRVVMEEDVGVRVVREWKLMRLCAWELMVFVS